ncbi:MAG: hypothetical protein B6U89_04585 [Desulfurococcales archaeon ex4484_58]|nr:MAG: hypothetical protein B6U89_04585 [Desulfurococcales archaeon ex4484_58]
MIKGPYYLIGRAREKDVFLTKHALEMVRKRKIPTSKLLDAIRYPWKILKDAQHSSPIPGFHRRVYVSKKNELIVIVDEDSMIIIVTSWKKTKDLEEFISKRVERGIWVEE